MLKNPQSDYGKSLILKRNATQDTKKKEFNMKKLVIENVSKHYDKKAICPKK